MICLLSLGPSHLAALMGAHLMSAARIPAQFDALRRCEGLIGLDRLVSLDLAGTTGRPMVYRRELTQPGRPSDT